MLTNKIGTFLTRVWWRQRPTDVQNIQVSSLRWTSDSTSVWFTRGSRQWALKSYVGKTSSGLWIALKDFDRRMCVLPRYDSQSCFTFHSGTLRASYLRIQSRACVKTCGAMPCSCCRIRHCSRVTDMAVRSLALLQLVKRTPLSRRQIWHGEEKRYWSWGQSVWHYSIRLLWVSTQYRTLSSAIIWPH